MATNQQMRPGVANAMARQQFLATALDQTLLAKSESLVLSSGNIVQPQIEINPACVGLEMGFFIMVEATITNGTGGTITLTPFGGSNLLRNAKYTDLQSIERTNCEGKFLDLTATQKQGRPFGASTAPDTGHPVNYGTWNSCYAPATLASGASDTIRHWFYLPLSYSEVDLRGAVWAQINNGYQRLNLTFPTVSEMICTSTANPVDAIYQSASATTTATITSMRYEVYTYTYSQNLPQNDKGYIVPLDDISTLYAINQTTKAGLVANQDFTIDYPAAWQYLSTSLIYVNGSQLNTGSDVTNATVKTASGVEFGRYTPHLHALTTINRIGTAPPAGCYYHSHHKHPISTTDYGAVSYVLKPSVVNSNASVRVAYEFFAPTTLYSTTGLVM